MSPTVSTPTGVFSQRFRSSISLSWNPGCGVYLASQLFLLVYPHTNVGPPGAPASTLLRALSTPAAISAPPTGMEECFFFNSLVVGLPYSLIFWQLWLFLIFKFVVVLLVVQRGAVCLPAPPSWPEVLRCLPLAGGKSHCFHFWAVVSNAAMSISG